jgi:hypothetical protein
MIPLVKADLLTVVMIAARVNVELCAAFFKVTYLVRRLRWIRHELAEALAKKSESSHNRSAPT